MTEINVSTGALVRVITGPQYQFSAVSAVALAGPDLFVSNGFGGPNSEGSLIEINATTGALVRVLESSQYQLWGAVALTVAGSDLFVANASSVSEVDALTGAFVRTLSPWPQSSQLVKEWPNALTVVGDDLFVGADLGNLISATRLPR